MMMFWLIFLIIKLDLVFSKNVEIIKDSPPKIIPVNEGSVYIDYQNSVVIQNFSHIRNVELRVKIGSNNYKAAYASRDGNSPYSGIYHQQKLQEGRNLLAGIRPCTVYDVLRLYFYSDKDNGRVENTFYDFDYQPYKIALEHADDWICAENSTFVYLSIKDSSIYQARECQLNKVARIENEKYVCP